MKIIDNRIFEDRETRIEEVLDIIKAPDFPTGGIILGTRGCEEAYRTGRGKIKVRAVTDIETLPNGKSQIIVSEIPYLVNKANLIIKIAAGVICAVCGTVNLDCRSMHIHYENAVFFSENQAVGDMKEDFLDCLEQCEEISYEEWTKRPLWKKMIHLENRYRMRIIG